MSGIALVNNYYVYQFLRTDGTPYYIGKGRNDRCYRRSGPKDRANVTFLVKDVCELTAFAHEIFWIAVYGRKDLGTGILRNRTDGGDGASNPSEETRALLRKRIPWNRGKTGYKDSEETKQRKSTAALRTGRKPPPSIKGVPCKQLVCNVCNKEGGAGAMTRFHFKNCKSLVEVAL